MNRRELLRLSAAVFAVPRLALAQKALPRLALFSTIFPVTAMNAADDGQWGAFIDELGRQGFHEGGNIILERYSANGATVSASAELARTVVATSPDLIFSGGSATFDIAALKLTNSIPLVATSGDLVSNGVISDLTHRPSNRTGLNTTASDQAEGKVLAVLAEAVPAAHSVAYVNIGAGDQINAAQQNYLHAAAQEAAEKLGLVFKPVVLHDPGGEPELREVFSKIAESHVDMVQLGTTSSFEVNAALTAKLALDLRLPTASPFPSFAEAGGLLSYGADLFEVYRGAARYVAMILKGARPADLPVLQPTAFDFIVNQRTAAAIGLTLPQSFLVQATKVIS